MHSTAFTAPAILTREALSALYEELTEDAEEDENDD